MKQWIVGALAFGLVGAMMATAGAGAASTDTGQPREVVAGKDKVPPQTSRPGVKTPRKATGSDAPGSDRMFNPQPELPERKAKAAGNDTPASERMFNPQPELPERKADDSAVKVANPGSVRTFNPQPELPDKPATAAGSN